MKIQISEAMSKKIFTVKPDTPIPEAYEYLRECRVRHLVVVDRNHYVTGVISDRDFQRAMLMKTGPEGGVKVLGEYFNPDHQVQDFMNWNTQTISQDAGLKQVALKMLECKISSLVVIDNDSKMVGFLTTDDLLWVLVKLVDEDKEKDKDFVMNLKAQILNSPLGAILNTASQAGI